MSKASNMIRKILPTVLTVLGSGATIAAVIFAAKEGPKFKEALDANPEMSKKDKVVTGAKVFCPAIGCAAVSVACGVGAHCMDLNTQASLTGAYVAVQQAYKNYRLKNGEINGEEADVSVREAIEEEKLPDEGVEYTDIETGEKRVNAVLKDLYEDCPDISFMATRFDIANAVVRINRHLDLIGSVTLWDVIGYFDIEPSDYGIDRLKAQDIGWSYESIYNDVDGRYASSWLDFAYTCSGDGSYVVQPICRARYGFEMCEI